MAELKLQQQAQRHLCQTDMQRLRDHHRRQGALQLEFEAMQSEQRLSLQLTKQAGELGITMTSGFHVWMHRLHKAGQVIDERPLRVKLDEQVAEATKANQMYQEIRLASAPRDRHQVEQQQIQQETRQLEDEWQQECLQRSAGRQFHESQEQLLAEEAMAASTRSRLQLEMQL